MFFCLENAQNVMEIAIFCGVVWATDWQIHTKK